ncbi:MAG: CsgG/HfaB family protein, partial [Acidimicrobiales bacterium]
MRVARLPISLSLAAAVALAACARGGAPAPVSAADVAALEAQRAAQPNDPDINLKLARAYYGTKRWADARAALGLVLRVRPADGEAQAYLALTYEELAHFDSARAVYTGLAATKQSKDVERLIRGRVLLLERRELQAAARQALAREAQLSATPLDPNTVAVMPFRYTGQDTTLRPLERGLAALVVTDLSRIQQLKLVERERLQALIDELQLADAGRVDPATGARSGRLMGAGQVVQGQFREVPTANFRIEATAVRASDGGVAATGSGSDQLRQLFDIEKTVVLQLVQRMGITLTPAERQAIQERPTRDVQAFLLYSRGLEA